MKKENLIITVSGETKSGKSRLCYLLKEFLVTQGYNIELQLNEDFKDMTHFNETMSENLNEALDNIRSNSIITLRDQQYIML